MELEFALHARRLQEARAVQQRAYMSTHPEIRQVLHDFVCSCLTLKPTDVRQHARTFFAQFLPDLGGAEYAPALRAIHDDAAKPVLQASAVAVQPAPFRKVC